MIFQASVALLALAAPVLGGSSHYHNTTTTSANSAACATVSASWASQIAASPSATPTVAASLAHDCLNSVPLGASEALELVESIRPYLDFQSDVADLKDPPPTYFYPPFDVIGKYESIKKNLQRNVYKNEYEFQQDLYQLFTPAHDGHYIMYPDLLTKAFEWGRQRALVSISSDGSEIPEIYIYEDVTTSPSTASVVKTINGIDAATYVANWSYTASFNQDADAAYNTMFYEKAFEAGGTGNGYFSINGRVRFVYPGPSTSFTFANGTSIELDNIAHVKGAFTNVTDGPSFYKAFCTPASSSSDVQSKQVAPVIAPGYPEPVVTTNDSIVSGYYLDGEGFDDVAVISLLAFESESPVEFQAVAQNFFADAVAAGKKKLVVDLSANGGGYILQGFDLFRQLFPHIVQEDYTRFRESKYFLDIAHILSDAIPADYNPNTASEELIEDYEVWFNYRYDYNFTEQPFETFKDKFTPRHYKGDEYTQLIRWNFNDPLTTSNSTWGFGTDITGYGSRTNFTQPFAAEDIIMLYDGYCASTCTIFSEFMRIQAGVKSIAMGGRPNTDPIQGVGGIKGAQILAFSDILSEAQFAIAQTTDADKISTLKELTDLPIARSSSTGVNVRDNILPDHVEDGLPAQYVVEEADCRLFYTLDMVKDVRALWKGAAAAAWNGAKCVAGNGLAKKSHIPRRDNIKVKSPFEVKREMAARREVFKRMEKAKGVDPRFRLRYGGKAIV